MVSCRTSARLRFGSLTFTVVAAKKITNLSFSSGKMTGSRRNLQKECPSLAGIIEEGARFITLR